MQVRPKVLFISSWYPTVLKPTEGNFVQQHIISAQQIADVALVHVVLSPTHQIITHEAVAAPYEAHLVYIPKSEVFLIGFCSLPNTGPATTKLPIHSPRAFSSSFCVGLVKKQISLCRSH